MNKRTISFIVAAVVLFAIYAVNFTDWFKPKSIRISYRSTPANFRGQTAGAVTFLLHDPYALTSIKVFTEEEFKSKKYPRPIWHLVAENGTALLTDFQYGAAVKGMKLENPKLTPEPLKGGTNYTIVIEAGKKLRGQRNFTSTGSSRDEDYERPKTLAK